jgi:(2Fe-2S) ferredoxin
METSPQKQPAAREDRTIKKLRHHVFVCLNERPAGHVRGCCKSRNSEAILQEFKTQLAARGMTADIRAQKSGCLDICEHGPALVVYPEGVWYGRVQVSDVSEIVESHLAQGRPVERLRLEPKSR